MNTDTRTIEELPDVARQGDGGALTERSGGHRLRLKDVFPGRPGSIEGIWG
jgi:hypothetical protein